MGVKILTNAERSHGSPLCVYLVDVRQPPCESVWGNLVPVFISEFSGLCAGACHLIPRVSYEEEWLA
jgi:hypothetical protein